MSDNQPTSSPVTITSIRLRAFTVVSFLLGCTKLFTPSEKKPMSFFSDGTIEIDSQTACVVNELPKESLRPVKITLL